MSSSPAMFKSMTYIFKMKKKLKVKRANVLILSVNTDYDWGAQINVHNKSTWALVEQGAHIKFGFILI